MNAKQLETFAAAVFGKPCLQRTWKKGRPPYKAWSSSLKAQYFETEREAFDYLGTEDVKRIGFPKEQL